MTEGAAANLSGSTIKGEKTGKEWSVKRRISFEPGVSAGHHSFGYELEDSKGNQAFLKVTDLKLAGAGEAGFLQTLKYIVDSHTVERTLLDRATGARMDRIVTVIDYGTFDTVHDGAAYSILFIIFEFAHEGDLRRHIRADEQVELLYIISISQNIANAISQLHRSNIRHNDIKPGNCLVFSKELQKLGDLGRATSDVMESPHDVLFRAGDPQYAPPEQLYEGKADDLGVGLNDLRVLGDIYGLGSIVHFLLTGRMITPEIFALLDKCHVPTDFGGTWGGSYYDALPYVRNAWASLFQRLRESLDDDGLKTIREELISLAEMASNPDPRERGAIVRGRQTLSLQYFMSKFDLLKRKAMVKGRA